MFYELVNSLTDAQRRKLADMGIPSPRVSEWKNKKVLPGRTHTLALSQVTGADLDALNRDLTRLELERDNKRNDAFSALTSMMRGQWQHS